MLNSAFEDLKSKFLLKAKEENFQKKVVELHKQIYDYKGDFGLLQYLLILGMFFAERKSYSSSPITPIFYKAILKCRDNDEKGHRYNEDTAKAILYMTLGAQFYIDQEILTEADVMNATPDKHPEGMILFKTKKELDLFIEQRIIELEKEEQRLKNIDLGVDLRWFHRQISALKLIQEYPETLRYEMLFFAPLVNKNGVITPCFGLIGSHEKAEEKNQRKRIKDKTLPKKEEKLEEKQSGKEIASTHIAENAKDESKSEELPIINVIPREVENEQKNWEYIEPEYAKTEVIEIFNKLQNVLESPEKDTLGTFKIGKKEVKLEITHQISKELDEEGIRERFEHAASKGFVPPKGQTGIKKLAEVGDLNLLEVKVLGNMQNGRCTIGDSRLMCIWDKRESIIYGFAMMNHKEVHKTTESFKKEPDLFYEKVMEQFNQKSFLNMISKASNEGFSHGY